MFDGCDTVTPLAEAHPLAGDILAVRGTGFFSQGILRLTGNTVSHVGVLVAEQPVTLVTEALWRVKTRPIEQSIAEAEAAFLLQPKNLTLQQVRQIVQAAAEFSSDSYGWWDIGLQLLNVAFRTTAFTDHAIGLRQHPICSALAAFTYGKAGLTFGKESWESLSPADEFNFARAHPDIYDVVRIK